MTRSSALAVGLVAAALTACAPTWKRTPHDERFQREPLRSLHRMPADETLPTDWLDRGTSSTLRPLARVFSPARYLLDAGGGREPLDVNGFGEVPDSAWFENRIGRRDFTPEEIAAGPGNWTEPAPGPLTVISGKFEGSTPGLVMRDTAGIVYYVKFDPPAFPEMSSGAELIAQRMLHAAGYHVPEIQIMDLALDRLVLDPEARRADAYHREVPMTPDYLRRLLSNLNPSPNGRLRALVSRSTPGRSVGPFSYRGVRVDDPNDRIAHERRRTLRGLWVFSAWLNNTDVRRQNTLDVFIDIDRRRRLGYVRHYLIDFGDALGSAGERDKYQGQSYEGQIGWGAMGLRFLGLGLLYERYLAVHRSPYPAVAMFEADIFEPGRWRSAYPNPAFEEATALDTFWAAAILARIDRPHVVAAVGAARYREPEVSTILVELLMKRRAKILAHAFRDFVPLGDPAVNRTRVALRDLEVVAGLRRPSEPDAPAYSYSIRWNRTARRDCELERGSAAEPVIDLAQAIRRARARDPEGFADDPFLTISWWRPRSTRRGPRLELHVRAVGDHVVLTGLRRERERWRRVLSDDRR